MTKKWEEIETEKEWEEMDCWEQRKLATSVLEEKGCPEEKMSDDVIDREIENIEKFIEWKKSK